MGAETSETTDAGNPQGVSPGLSESSAEAVASTRARGGGRGRRRVSKARRRRVPPLDPAERDRDALLARAEETFHEEDPDSEAPGGECDPGDGEGFGGGDSPPPSPPSDALTAEEAERFAGAAARTVLYVVELLKARRDVRPDAVGAETDADTFAADAAPELARWPVLARPLRLAGMVGGLTAAVLRSVVRRAERAWQAPKVVEGKAVHVGGDRA